MKSVIYFSLLLSMLVVAGCSKGPKRLDPNDRVILEERVNLDDMVDTATRLSRRAVTHRWLNEWSQVHPDRSPIVCVLEIKNRTDQVPLKTELLTKTFEKEMIDSGRVNIMTERELREHLRLERTDQEFTAEQYRQMSFNTEFKPDYLLYGIVSSDRERSRSQSTFTSQISMELLDVQTNRKVWVDFEIVKKGVR